MLSFLSHRSWRLTWLRRRPSSSVVVRHPQFQTLISPRPVGQFNQILSLASLGWGKGCVRFWGRLDWNYGYHDNRKLPLTYNAQNGVMFSQSPLIGSLSNLQVTRTGIKSWMSLNLSRVGLFTTDLFALGRSHWLWMGKILSPSFYVPNFEEVTGAYLFGVVRQSMRLFVKNRAC